MNRSKVLRSVALACTVGAASAMLLLPRASAGVTNCGDLIICIEVPGPGGTTGGGAGGTSNGGGGSTGGGGSGEPGFTQGNGEHTAVGDTTSTGSTGGNAPQPQTPTDAEVATLAMAQLELRKPIVHMTPEAGNLGLVGLPVWLWIDSTDPHRWSREGISKTVTERGVTVTATARSSYVSWSMGDGSTVTCDKPGTKYDPSSPRTSSPDCGYIYRSTSGGQSKNRFTVTATVHWEASYVGADGVIHVLPNMAGETSTTARVGELQVVN